MPPAENDEASAAVFNCPQCGEEVDVLPSDASAESPFMICPHCKSEFVVTRSPTPDEDEETRRLEEEKATRRDGELDSLRIRNLALARRAAIRSRSYALIGMLVSVVGIGQLIYLTVTHVRREGWDVRPIGYILLSIAAVVGAVYCYRRARELQIEASRSALTDPTAPPDFSTLGDGSQRWKNLEDVR